MFENMIEFGLNATNWLQSSFPAWAEPMRVISMFGNGPLVLLVLFVIFWSVDKRVGISFISTMVLTALIVAIFKDLLHQPRPFWYPEVTLLEESAKGYGLPSGHTQGVTVLLLLVSLHFRESWLWIFSTVAIVAMGISRVYLGSHFVHDVIGGFLLGCIVILARELWLNKGAKRFRSLYFGQRVLFVVTLPLVILVSWAVITLWIRNPITIPAGVDSALADAADIYETHVVVRELGIVLGILTGFTIEESRVRFLNPKEIWKKLACLLVGAVVLVALYMAGDWLIDLITTDELLLVALPLRFIFFTLVGLTATWYVPKLFVGLGLAPFSAELSSPYSIQSTTLPNYRE